MSETAFSFDASNIAPDTGFDILPSGWYNVTITAASMEVTKAQTGRYIKAQMQVADGPHAGRVVFTQLNVENPNPKAVEIGFKQLASICHAVGVLQFNDLQQLFGRPFMVKVKAVPPTEDYEAKNDAKGFKACTGEPSCADPAPTFSTAAPAASAAAPAAVMAPGAWAQAPVAAPAPAAPAPVAQPQWAPAAAPAAPVQAPPAAPPSFQAQQQAVQQPVQAPPQQAQWAPPAQAPVAPAAPQAPAQAQWAPPAASAPVSAPPPQAQPQWAAPAPVAAPPAPPQAQNAATVAGDIPPWAQ